MHISKVKSFVLLILSVAAFTAAAQDKYFEADLPDIIVQDIAANIGIRSPALSGISDTAVAIRVNGNPMVIRFIEGTGSFSHVFRQSEELTISMAGERWTKQVTPIPLWMSILPPLIAIVFALLFREVYSALFIGLLVGATIISFYQGENLAVAIVEGIFRIVDTYIIESLTDRGHLSIIIFSMLIGAMVHLITRNGGMKGVIAYLSRYAKTPRSGQFITWLLGVMIFFDDYANTLVVGNTMRPVADRLRISREKLAYIVDSTAAPVASIAFVTTWIGAELSYIQDGIETIGLEAGAYNVFISSLAYSFYPIFALALIVILIFRQTDFGPMRQAEARVRAAEFEGYGKEMKVDKEMEGFSDDDTVPGRWFNAVIPVLVVILGTVTGLLYTGWDPSIWEKEGFTIAKKLSMTIGLSDSYLALLWASMGGVVVAVILTISQRILSLKDSMESLMNGFKTMLTAVLILTLAWTIALITEYMHTAEFISQAMLSFSLSPFLVPVITFILAALVSFSTGSSWGTMAILYPLILPAAWLIGEQSGLEHGTTLALFYNVVSCVLAGSVLGDHCSPISDTTILSSLASGCNHIEHVRTQLPYAITAGIVSILAGTLPAAYGVSSWILFPSGILIILVMVILLGKKNARVDLRHQAVANKQGPRPNSS